MGESQCATGIGQLSVTTAREQRGVRGGTVTQRGLPRAILGVVQITHHSLLRAVPNDGI